METVLTETVYVVMLKADHAWSVWAVYSPDMISMMVADIQDAIGNVPFLSLSDFSISQAAVK